MTKLEQMALELCPSGKEIIVPIPSFEKQARIVEIHMYIVYALW